MSDNIILHIYNTKKYIISLTNPYILASINVASRMMGKLSRTVLRAVPVFEQG